VFAIVIPICAECGCGGVSGKETFYEPVSLTI